MPLPDYILIIEPSEQLTAPYVHFNSSAKVVRTSSLKQGLSELASTPAPDLLMISASFSPERLHEILEAAKAACQTSLFPLIMVVNLAQPVSHIPGTTWGNKMAVLHSLSSPAEIDSTLARILA